MPSKRVSLKGKGAELFFGDYSPNAEAPEEAQDSSPLLPAESSDLPRSGDSTTTVAVAEHSAAPEAPVTPAFSPRPPRQTTRRIQDEHSQASSKQATASDSTPASTSASKLASRKSSPDKEAIAAIRKTVRIPGREVSYTRLTSDEKQQLADIVYAYKQKGQKTSENEINRIAINHLLLDYHERGNESVLANVLAALLA